jgi:hypothetical protein
MGQISSDDRWENWTPEELNALCNMFLQLVSMGKLSRQSIIFDSLQEEIKKREKPNKFSALRDDELAILLDWTYILGKHMSFAPRDRLLRQEIFDELTKRGL